MSLWLTGFQLDIGGVDILEYHLIRAPDLDYAEFVPGGRMAQSNRPGIAGHTRRGLSALTASCCSPVTRRGRCRG